MAGATPRPVIRPATPHDAERCGEIAVEAWRIVFESWRGLLGEKLWRQVFGDWQHQKRTSVESQVRDSPDSAIVTEVDGEIVGFMTWRLHRERGVGEISNNAVLPAWQGRGIGTEQCRHVLERFREEKMACARVLTGGDEGHAAARAMYRAAGFERAIPYVEYFLEL
ncbi:MAG: GNAT family N-acetyltransferase [Armatimonadota bacterium]